MKKEQPGHILFFSSWSYKEPLTHSYYLPNIRIIRRLVSADTKIYVQTWEKKQFSITPEEKKKISETLLREGIIWVPLTYHPFGAKAMAAYLIQMIRLLFFVLRKGIRVLHPFAPAAATTALFIKMISGRKLVVDSWEPHAECMTETGVWKKESLSFKILWRVEKSLAQRADILIAASRRMTNYAEENFGKIKGSILFRPACIDLNMFSRKNHDVAALRRAHGFENKTVCACVSKLGGLYLKEEVFMFFKAGADVFGKSFHALLLSENKTEEVQELCARAGFPSEQLTHLHVAHSEVPAWLASCDFAFNPQQPVPSKRYGTPVKDGEYWAMGLPVVILPDISEDSEIIVREHAGVILETLSKESMHQTMQAMKNLLDQTPDIATGIRKVAEKYRSYDLAEETYRRIYSK